ncbi:hypothetical protein [Calothrix sp. PCC 7507]|uniref:hypothetical protein n=1 Tax=Calothrix sp. PCC 7507 TaxID=99598 RepID=UPI00029F1DC4|nr:hypothetical protein [Calothrix sp. PCC 7507]AFY35831.1 hypothetical protein Cal7507_5500 [Calothrix sp. PCC 7507]
MNRKAFTVTKSWGNCYIRVKSIATGNLYDVRYTSQIGADDGDTVSVLIDGNENWKTIINERTGNSATVSSISRV